MYRYAPKPKRIRERIVLSVCLVLAAAAYCLGNVGLPYPVIYQMMAIGLFGAAACILLRYMLRDYVYRLEEGRDGAVELTVTELYARRETVVCRIRVQDVVEARRFGRGEKSDRSVRRFVYTAERFPKDGCLLSASDGDGGYEVVICADEDLYRLISELAKEKKQEMSDFYPTLT